MASIPLSDSALAAVKKSLRKEYPDVRSSHLSEALATALGRRTHAALLVDAREQSHDPFIELLDDERFDARLQEFGYPADPEFSFELLMEMPDCIISTMPTSGFDIEYRSTRDKAWRNLMVLAINEGIRRKLFSLKPYDNRWPGAEPESQGHRGTDFLFDFDLPDGKPAKGYVSDAGFGELSIHAAVNPKGDWVRTSNGGFEAGDAFARGWLERDRGAYLQHSPEMFSCRRILVKPLGDMNVAPHGFGDRGRVIV